MKLVEIGLGVDYMANSLNIAFLQKTVEVKQAEIRRCF